MTELDIARMVPQFILQDKNGFALAKAIETGLSAFMTAVQDGVSTILDPDKMPEWRLDEMAWEMGGLYDYNATVEEKRVWIKEAVPLYESYGTATAIEKYLKGYFHDAEVEENWQYNGQPYHFRVTVNGEMTDTKMRIAQKAAETLKNVRSVMDNISIGKIAGIEMRVETDYFHVDYAQYPKTGTLLSGLWPGQTLH